MNTVYKYFINMKQQKITTISNLPLAKGYMCVLTKNKKGNL